MRRPIAVAMGAVGGSALVGAVVLTGWLAVVAGAQLGSSASCDIGPSDRVPAELRPVFDAAATRYDLGPDGPAILAGLTSVESRFGQNMGPSKAGAIGWTQFLPRTWSRYGVDADGDGVRDPYNAIDAVFSAANYLRASGAPDNWRHALFIYNHAESYVEQVLAESRRLMDEVAGADACAPWAIVENAGAAQIHGGGRIVAIPGQPGQRIDERILADVIWMIRSFHVSVTAGYAPQGHKAHGEHPLGLAVDLVPGPAGSWDDVDRLAHWAEPVQGRPRPPFRWVGYDGDNGHGRGDHLHLSWRHAPDPALVPPAQWVEVIERDG